MYEKCNLCVAFLKVVNNPSKHWKDYVGWEIVERLDHVVLIASKKFWLQFFLKFCK
jgi:hypothetical protein